MTFFVQKVSFLLGKVTQWGCDSNWSRNHEKLRKTKQIWGDKNDIFCSARLNWNKKNDEILEKVTRCEI